MKLQSDKDIGGTPVERILKWRGRRLNGESSGNRLPVT